MGLGLLRTAFPRPLGDRLPRLPSDLGSVSPTNAGHGPLFVRTRAFAAYQRRARLPLLDNTA
jgi:hypothetical protein